MSKELMLSARDLIKAKKYDEARAILQNIDHPKAKEWLANLDKVAPVKAAATPRQARPKAAPKPKPAIDEEDPDAFLDDLMARKRPAQRRPVSPKAAAKSSKKPGFRYFLVYGLIFIIFLGAMLVGALMFLNDDDSDAIATSDAIGTENAEGLNLTATAAAFGGEDFALTLNADAATLEAINGLSENTPEPEVISTPEP
jgi:hypothetical protein